MAKGAVVQDAGGGCGGEVIHAMTLASGLLLAAMLLIALVNLATARRLSAGPAGGPMPRVSVLVPARNEASRIGAALESLRQTDYPEFEILVLDDESSDGTVDVVREYQAREPRLRLLEGRPKPGGWVGKCWACHQLAAAAYGDILIFCDADVRARPHAVRHTIATMQRGRADVLTALPRQTTPQWWEAALVPLMTQVPILSLLPLREVERSKSPALSAGNGQWLAFTRDAYEASGGHEAIRGKVLEDVELARRAKAAGQRLVVALAPHDLAVRMYDDAAAMREGFQKNLYPLLGGRVVTLVVALLIWILTMGYPLVAPMVAGSWGWVLLMLLVAVRVSTAVAARHSAGSVVLHPIGVVLGLLAAVDSAAAAWSGSARWKGRALPSTGDINHEEEEMTEAEEMVVLVDQDDREIGTRGKLEAHRTGELHRAFSVFVVNSAGEVLLQRRAEGKYHSAGLWSNSCCGHPRPGEGTVSAARRRLHEEMGIACDLDVVGSFRYRAELGGGMMENELDHVLIGSFEGDPKPHPDEASDWRWVEIGALRAEISHDPQDFTAWVYGALEVAAARLRTTELAPHR